MGFYKEPLRWIRLAVESILNQTYKDFEFIIICDNPEYHEAITYIRELQATDSRINLIINETNCGLTKSLNSGISIAKGEYIARMDADDIAFHDRFEKQINFLHKHPEISVCATDVHLIDEDGKIIRRNKYRKKYNPINLLVQNTLAHPSVMFRKNLTELRQPLYNEDFTYSQDYELWQFIYLKGKSFHTLCEPLLFLRKSKIQISIALRQQQAHYFKKAHKSMIINWLTNHHIISSEDGDNLYMMLSKCSAKYKNAYDEEKSHLALIIYVLYFCLGTSEWMYRLRYLTDRNHIVFKVKFILTFRLFFSRRSRRNRAGFL